MQKNNSLFFLIVSTPGFCLVSDGLVDDHSTAITNMGERVYELEKELAESIDNVSDLQSLQRMTRKRACSDSVSDDTDTQKHPRVAP